MHCFHIFEYHFLLCSMATFGLYLTVKIILEVIPWIFQWAGSNLIQGILRINFGPLEHMWKILLPGRYTLDSSLTHTLMHVPDTSHQPPTSFHPTNTLLIPHGTTPTTAQDIRITIMYFHRGTQERTHTALPHSSEQSCRVKHSLFWFHIPVFQRWVGRYKDDAAVIIFMVIKNL